MTKEAERVHIFFVDPHYVCHWNETTGDFKIVSHAPISGGRELKLLINSNGYYATKLNNKGFVVHQFLGDRLFGERKRGYCVNHIDGNKLNNSKSNLEYITLGENTRHAVKLGLHVSSDPRRSGRYIDGRATKENLSKYKYEWLKRKKAKQNQIYEF